MDISAPALYLVLGCGLGYPLIALQRRQPPGPVLGMGHNAPALAAGLAHLDYTTLPKAPYLWGGPPDYRFKRLVVALLPPNLRVEYVNAHTVSETELAACKKLVDEAIAERAQDIMTRTAMEPTWAVNIAANACAFLASPGIDALFSQYQGVPAVLARAGPSLQLATVRGPVTGVCALAGPLSFPIEDESPADGRYRSQPSGL